MNILKEYAIREIEFFKPIIEKIENGEKIDGFNDNMIDTVLEMYFVYDAIINDKYKVSLSQNDMDDLQFTLGKEEIFSNMVGVIRNEMKKEIDEKILKFKRLSKLNKI